jgi:hypothetical protein
MWENNDYCHSTASNVAVKSLQQSDPHRAESVASLSRMNCDAKHMQEATDRGLRRKLLDDTQNTHEYSDRPSTIAYRRSQYRSYDTRYVVCLQQVMNSPTAEPRTITGSVPDAEINVLIQILCLEIGE